MEVTKESFLQSSQVLSSLTPLEVDIVYLLTGHNTGKINYNNLQDIDSNYETVTGVTRLAEVKAVSEPQDRDFLIGVLESLYRFTLGSVAGACGATAVYPIDLVKTRMQNQRSTFVGEVQYLNYFDCFRKVGLIYSRPNFNNSPFQYDHRCSVTRGCPVCTAGCCPRSSVSLPRRRSS